MGFPVEHAGSAQLFQTSAGLEHCHTHLFNIGIDEGSGAHHLVRVDEAPHLGLDCSLLGREEGRGMAGCV